VTRRLGEVLLVLGDGWSRPSETSRAAAILGARSS